ncbi:MAG TPA: Hsp20/alpha crystallin family protein [Actinomycetota bacterium]|jgi:HSP20 family protein
MAMSRWDPFRDLLAIQNEMNRLFGRTYGGQSAPVEAAGDAAVPAAEVASDPRGSWAPLLDVFETPEKLSVAVELPGMSASDVEITVEGNVLTLRGQRPFYKGANEEAFHRIERRFGPFQRRIALPNQSDAERISAQMEEGVLMIDVPKIEHARPRRIEVKASQT